MASSTSTEIRRRTRVARIFPNNESLLRVASALAIERNEQWTLRRYLLISPKLGSIVGGPGSGIPPEPGPRRELQNILHLTVDLLELAWACWEIVSTSRVPERLGEPSFA